ncbi:MAG: universal stress protein [Alphaproteobacteria bacterium]|jgi:nucleotide-binding universal stress UspA family protein|nr:universal stress protein [Alphaproteobacteria bacterium]
MKTLLMATDLSARSERALERAMALARERDATLVVVHVVDEELPSALAETQADEARRLLRARCDGLAEGAGAKVTVDVVRGRPYAAIRAAATRHGAELVVLGSHRHDLWRDMFRGTTAERVVRTCAVPVLLVREPVDGPYRRVLAAVDFSVFARRAVEFTLAFLPNAEVELIHAFNVPFGGFLSGEDTRDQMVAEIDARFRKLLDEEMAGFLAHLDDAARHLHCVMQEGGVREVITARVQQTAPDLLVIGTHGKSGLAHAFLGSVAEDLLRNPPCDVLTVGAW